MPPQNPQAEVLPTHTSDYVFGDRAPKEVIKLGWTQIQHDCPSKKGKYGQRLVQREDHMMTQREVRHLQAGR